MPRFRWVRAADSSLLRPAASASVSASSSRLFAWSKLRLSNASSACLFRRAILGAPDPAPAWAQAGADASSARTATNRPAAGSPSPWREDRVDRAVERGITQELTVRARLASKPPQYEWYHSFSVSWVRPR